MLQNSEEGPQSPDEEPQDGMKESSFSVQNSKVIKDQISVVKKQNEELTKWLKNLGLQCYAEIFIRENLALESLPELDDEHLKELGVTVGHRIKLKKAIEGLKTTTTEIAHTEYVCKVIVVGDIGTGKTSLIQRYTNGTFDRGYKATIGVDFCLKEIAWNKSTTISVQLWDIAGQERFANLTRMYYKEARGAFVVFDVFREKTFEAVLKWKADIDAKVTLPNGKVIPVVLLANKCDLTDKQINLEDFCKQHGFEKCFLTSAKEDIGINEAAQFLVQTILDNDENYLQKSAVEYGTGLVVRAESNEPKNQNSACCST